MIDYNITKKDDGTYSGTAYQTTSGLGKVTKVDNVKAIDKTDKIKKDKVKKEKPLLSTKLPDTTKLGSTVKPVKPGSNRDKMIAKNELRHGSDKIVNLRKKNADFQRMKKGEISKMDFMKQYPKSQTTKKYNMKQIERGKQPIRSHYEPYDLVLDYVLSEGHAETVEEAHYVMMQMDEGTIKTIVEFLGGRPGDGYLGHPNLNIENPFFKGKRTKGPVINKSNADFHIIDDNTLQYGLAAIKNVGYKAAEQIAKNRLRIGKYNSIFELITSFFF